MRRLFAGKPHRIAPEWTAAAVDATKRLGKSADHIQYYVDHPNYFQHHERLTFGRLLLSIFGLTRLFEPATTSADAVVLVWSWLLCFLIAANLLGCFGYFDTTTPLRNVPVPIEREPS